jgi:hypothetical protein
MKWIDSTKSMNDEMESIESQIDNAFGSYDLMNDVDAIKRLVIENIHEQFFQLQEQTK